jgi:hypothetical protein
MTSILESDAPADRAHEKARAAASRLGPSGPDVYIDRRGRRNLRMVAAIDRAGQADPGMFARVT